MPSQARNHPQIVLKSQDFTDGRERDVLILRAHQFHEPRYRLGRMFQ